MEVQKWVEMRKVWTEVRYDVRPEERGFNLYVMPLPNKNEMSLISDGGG